MTTLVSGFRALLFLCAVAVLGPTPARAADQPAAKALLEAIKPFMDRHELAGAVMLVADKDKVLALEGGGYADIAGVKFMRPDTVFWIASQSKAITAAGLMVLVDEGKVKLDDPIEKYLPEFRGQWLAVYADTDSVLLRKPRKVPTIRQALSHTSGMPFASALEQPTLDGVTLKDGSRSYAMTPLAYEPGTKWSYSNAGINTAGRIIEVVSGVPYETFMEKRLFGPLGMKDTTFWPAGEQLERLAKAYRPNKEGNGLEETKISQLRYPLDDRTRQPMPGGGLFSTATDVCHFCQMLLNHGTFEGKRVLSEAAVAEMTRKQTGALPNDYGLGLATAGGTFGHGGALATDMTVDPKKGLITVWLVQHQGFPGEGGKARGAFQKAAIEAFSNGK